MRLFTHNRDDSMGPKDKPKATRKVKLHKVIVVFFFTGGHMSIFGLFPIIGKEKVNSTKMWTDFSPPLCGLI